MDGRIRIGLPKMHGRIHIGLPKVHGPLTPIYLSLHGHEMMPFPPGEVNLYLVIRQDNLFSSFACPLLCGSALKSALEIGY